MQLKSHREFAFHFQDYLSSIGISVQQHNIHKSPVAEENFHCEDYPCHQPAKEQEEERTLTRTAKKERGMSNEK